MQLRAANAFLECELCVTKRCSVPRGAEAVKCTNRALMVGSLTSMPSFSSPKSLHPCDGQNFV